MGCKATFFTNSPAIGEKINAADRPSPADHRPQRVMQRFLKAKPGCFQQFVAASLSQPNPTSLFFFFFSAAYMSLRIYNTLTRAVSEFSPLQPGHVRMYV